MGFRWAFTADYVAFDNGPRSILFGGKEIGEGDFHLTARLAVTCPDVVPSFLARTNAIKGFHPFGHAAPIVARHRLLAVPLDRITPSRPFEFEAIRKADKVTFKIDGHAFHEASFSGDPLGTVGFTVYVKDGKYPRAPDVSQLRIFEFSVVGRTRPIQEWRLTETISSPPRSILPWRTRSSIY